MSYNSYSAVKIVYAPMDHKLTTASPPEELDRHRRAAATRVKNHFLNAQKACFPEKQSPASKISDIAAECNYKSNITQPLTVPQ